MLLQFLAGKHHHATVADIWYWLDGIEQGRYEVYRNSIGNIHIILSATYISALLRDGGTAKR